MTRVTIEWKKQARQMTFLRACGLSHPFEGGTPGRAEAKVIGYGGAAGGGKSDALLVAGIIACLTYQKCNVGYFRRKFVQLEGPGGAIMRSQQLISHIASYNQQKKRWTFPNGSVLQFCHLEHETSVYDYQSQQFDIELMDEGTQFTRFQFTYMRTRNRATTNIPRPFVAIGTNPGGIGHMWFRDQFVDVGTPEQVHMVEIEEGKREEHLFIPAFLSDNDALQERDPEYRKNLENQPEHIRRQLLEGDWSAVEGVAFSEWREKYHVCDPFLIPDTWTKFRSLDWGYAAPYSVGWYAIDHDGRLYKYRELYGYGHEDNKGTRETPAEVAAKIIEAEEGEHITYAVADDAIFATGQDNSKSIAEQFADAFGTQAQHWSKVGKGPRSRIQGKLEVHHRLRIPLDETREPTGESPMIVFFRNCTHTIRTLPNLTTDEKNPEDVDTDLEDHAYDETRYACMSRPIASKKPKPKDTIIQKHKKQIIKRRRQQTARFA